MDNKKTQTYKDIFPLLACAYSETITNFTETRNQLNYTPSNKLAYANSHPNFLKCEI